MKNDTSKDKQISLFAEFEAKEAKAEKRILKIYAGSLLGYKKYFAKLHEDYENEEGKLTYDEILKNNRFGEMEEALKALTVKLYSDTSKEIESFFKSTYKESFDGMNAALKISIAKEKGRGLNAVIDEDVLNRALNNKIKGLKWTDRMGIHRETVVNKIHESVERGLREGLSYKQTAEILNDSLSGDVLSPVRIVRTESYRAFSQAKKDRMDKLKDKRRIVKEWVSCADELTRLEHFAMHGKKVLYDDVFILPSGHSAFGPGMFGIASEDINCRCFWIAEVLTDDEEFYRDYTFVSEIPEEYLNGTDNLTEDEKVLLKAYTGFTSVEVNKSLRQENANSKTQEKIKILEGALAKSSLPENIILKRGTTCFSFTELNSINDITEIVPGSLINKTLTDKGFASTGLLFAEKSGRDIIMNINVPKDSKGLYLYPVAHNKYKYQHEVLLNRNSKFLVKDAKFDEGKLLLEVDLIDTKNGK